MYAKIQSDSGRLWKIGRKQVLFHPGATRFNPATATLYNITLSVAEVESVLANLDTTKATGPDEISARLLKETAPVISTSLCPLYNKSLNQGVFPQEWKIANIVPVYKKGDKEYVENYNLSSLYCVESLWTLRTQQHQRAYLSGDQDIATRIYSGQILCN